MKRIRLTKPQATLVHPNDPDLQFVVERPPAADIIQFQDDIKQYDRQVIARDPDTKQILRKKDGSPEYLRLDPIFPVRVITDFLQKYVKQIRGLETEDGRPVDYRTDKEGTLRALMEMDFIVTQKKKIKVDDEESGGKIEVEKEVKTQCTQWLTEQICTEGTYRPLDGSTPSLSPVNGDSESKPTTAETVS